MEQTATAWLALQAGGGAFAIGVIFAARMLPSLLLGLIAGTIADRSDRPRQLLLVAGATLFLMAAFGWFANNGQIQVWHVALFSFAAGCLNVFNTTARQALILDTVPRSSAPRALALHALVSRVATALGALAIGVLISEIGIGSSYYVIAIIYGLMGALSALIQVPRAHNMIVTLPPFRRAFRDATHLLLGLPAVRTLFIIGVVCEIFAFSYGSALPLFAQEVLNTNAEGWGTLNAAGSIGGAIAVVLLSLIHSEMPRQPILGAVFLFYGVSLVFLTMTHMLALSFIALLVVGFCAACFDVLQQTLIQLAVPDEQRGRAVGVWILSTGSAPIGHLEMGTVAGLLGVATALLINGSLTIFCAVILLIQAPDYRWRRWRTKANVGIEDDRAVTK